MAALELEPLPKKKQEAKSKSKAKAKAKPKKSQVHLPEPQHKIEVLEDSRVFSQPTDEGYEFSFPYQIRARIVELEA